jgi:hypothetical protein
MDAELDTLALALYVKIDELLIAAPERVPWRPPVGIAPRISDAELVTLCVMQALLSFTSEARWLRHADAHLRHLFPYLPQQPGYNKRLRKLAGTVNWLIRQLAADTSIWADDVWVVDSTPIECARSRDATRTSQLAGWAESTSVRVLRQPFSLLLGTAAAPDRDPARPADRVRRHRGQGRRTPDPARRTGRRPRPDRSTTGPDVDRRQALLRPRATSELIATRMRRKTFAPSWATRRSSAFTARTSSATSVPRRVTAALSTGAARSARSSQARRVPRQCPRQDSNLRTRLRRPVLPVAPGVLSTLQFSIRRLQPPWVPWWAAGRPTSRSTNLGRPYASRREHDRGWGARQPKTCPRRRHR